MSSNWGEDGRGRVVCDQGSGRRVVRLHEIDAPFEVEVVAHLPCPEATMRREKPEEHGVGSSHLSISMYPSKPSRLKRISREPYVSLTAPPWWSTRACRRSLRGCREDRWRDGSWSSLVLVAFRAIRALPGSPALLAGGVVIGASAFPARHEKAPPGEDGARCHSRTVLGCVEYSRDARPASPPRAVVLRQAPVVVDRLDRPRCRVVPAPEDSVPIQRPSTGRETWRNDAGDASGQEAPRDRP